MNKDVMYRVSRLSEIMNIHKLPPAFFKGLPHGCPSRIPGGFFSQVTYFNRVSTEIENKTPIFLRILMIFSFAVKRFKIIEAVLDIPFLKIYKTQLT